MRTIADLKASLPQKGTVTWIGIRAKRKAQIEELTSVDIDVESGIRGDHYSKVGGNRMVTLIQAEHLDVVGKILDKKIHPSLLRRNIVISGLNLISLQDAIFKVGDVVLQGTGFCHPCSRMEDNLGPGGYNAMRGHGGITARVLEGGHLKITDIVAIQHSITT